MSLQCLMVSLVSSDVITVPDDPTTSKRCHHIPGDIITLPDDVNTFLVLSSQSP